MDQLVEPLSANTNLQGRVLIPASKSHTIRALLIAALADGQSTIINPLDSKDARSCIHAIRLFGAEVEEISGKPWGAERALLVQGVGNVKSPRGSRGILSVAPADVIDTGNSGTTLYLAAGIAALCPQACIFTGDHQIRNRPIENLLHALQDLGASARSSRENGCAPVIIQGPIKGGSTTVSCPTSQYLSALFLALPLAQADSTINISLLYEQPYAEMTLRWLDSQGIRYENHNNEWKSFFIPGGQHYSPFTRVVPGDFSSATFFAVAAALSASDLSLDGLDMNDSQGDKAVFGILEKMGCIIQYDTKDSSTGIRVIGPGNAANPQKQLQGGEFDLNPIPDALPALSVCACFASEEVRLVNVPQARLKETDRIAVMRQELSRMGANIQERDDGLIIKPSKLKGCTVEGHDDHRVVMSLALAALKADGNTIIQGAEAASVTFPSFFPLLANLGARTRSHEN